MRPHRLKVTAFGAFAGTVEVDFDALVTAGGLFLLHGETGAGKTTLLDAIGFALYGRVPGERGKARRLRSDHARASTATEVELEATIGGRRLRITRRPEQVRPKLRGEGLTSEQARILICELRNEAWLTVSTRAGEADQEIADLMGMSAEQFYQVVLLPQGQFARFLHADAEGRGKLLQRLFGTDRFRVVEDWLADRRRVTAHEVADASQAIAQLCARIAEVSGAAAPAEPDDAARWAHDGAAAAAAELATAGESLESSRTALAAAATRLQAAERLAFAQQRRGEALRRRDQLGTSAPRITVLRDELAAALRSAEVAGAMTAARQAELASATARGAEQRARQAARGAEQRARQAIANVPIAQSSPLDRADCAIEPADLAAATAAELRAAGQGRLRYVGRLEALRSVAEQADDEDAAAAKSRTTAQELAGAIVRCRADIEAAEVRQQATHASRDAAREAAAALPDSRAEADRLRRAATDAVALAQARDDGVRLRAEHLSAREHAVGLREQAAHLRESRIDGMRAELAATLVDHAPCPVCGALEHPEPCELRGDLVTKEQEEAADAAAEEAVRAAERVGAEVAAVQARADELTARLAAAPTAAAAPAPTAATVVNVPSTTAGGSEWHIHAAELDRLARVAEQEAARLGGVAAELPALQRAADLLARGIAEAQTRAAELTQQHEAALDQAMGAQRRADEYRDRLREQLGGARDLAAALTAARADAHALIAAADAAEAAARASEAAAQAHAMAAQAATDAGFAGIDDARTAYRDTAWREEATATISGHETETASVTALLAENDVALEPPADVAAAGHAADAARAAYDQAVATHARAQRKHEQLSRLLPELDRGLADFEPVREYAAEVRRLADLAAGQGANVLRMTLSSFVLAARLEEVAAAASQRLLRMTAGRYSLVHTDMRRGGGRSGLRLLARDAWTGQDRDTSTLSGGETFMASLALALGLADVVTEEAGGGRIEALFVDEGFGSLDEETLEEVMNVLDSLREGGRLVGIVSHVAELRQRIPAQIKVRKTQTGSHLAVAS